MPLEAGKSRAAFSHNVKAEIAANKPQKQAVAIAYAKQKGDVIDAVVAECDALFKRFDAYVERRVAMHRGKDGGPRVEAGAVRGGSATVAGVLKG